MVKKDTWISIPVLKKEDYFHWKVKMHLHLLSRDTSYVQCIEKGPHVPMKIVISVNVDGTMALLPRSNTVVEGGLNTTVQFYRFKTTKYEEQISLLLMLYKR